MDHSECKPIVLLYSAVMNLVSLLVIVSLPF